METQRRPRAIALNLDIIDGRHVVEIPELPGVMAYGSTIEEAVTRMRTIEQLIDAERADLAEGHWPVSDQLW